MSRPGERRIAAPADRLYALVADPVRHTDIDGSGSLVEAVEISSPVRPLGLCDHFGMKWTSAARFRAQAATAITPTWRLVVSRPPELPTYVPEVGATSV
jgi:hypothetical protein